MGALHAGHMSLVDWIREQCDLTVVSIFVNPIQFDRAEDLEAYPRTWDDDLAMCAKHGVQAVYAPTAQAMYPDGFQTTVSLKQLTQPMEGAHRPGHFDGVATVVLKLFNAVLPHVAAFGSKDYQQLKVVQRMARDLDLEVEVVGRPTVREPDGLALSSRNQHLSPREREQSLCLHRALNAARRMAQEGEGDAARLMEEAQAIIAAEPGAKLEYLEVFDAEELTPLAELDRPAVMALAAWVGSTRLIDNMVLN
jgi:pantoate--beta-alanine ligase